MTINVRYRLFFGIVIGFIINSIVFGLIISNLFVLRDDLKDKKKILIDRKYYIMCEYSGRRDFECR